MLDIMLLFMNSEQLWRALPRSKDRCLIAEDNLFAKINLAILSAMSESVPSPDRIKFRCVLCLITCGWLDQNKQYAILYHSSVAQTPTHTACRNLLSNSDEYKHS